jgi:Trk/Ktr/HKT type cation transporter
MTDRMPFLHTFNFILFHYLYLISMALVGSIILVPGNMPYIDALFFAAGASTQSGLNTYVGFLFVILQELNYFLELMSI